jgi:hypothetical protein
MSQTTGVRRVIGLILLPLAVVVLLAVVFPYLQSAAAWDGNSDAEISWALGWVDLPTYIDATELPQPALNSCERFVESAFGLVGAANNPNALWNTMPPAKRHANDTNAPRGALVFWSGPSADGHIAISLGDGTHIDAGGTTVAHEPDSVHSIQGYLGWAWAPMGWPGRSGAYFTAEIPSNGPGSPCLQVSGDRVVWQDWVDTDGEEIFTWTPTTGPVQVSDDDDFHLPFIDWGDYYHPVWPQVSGDRVVWNIPDPVYPPSGYGEIFTWTPSTGTVRLTNNWYDENGTQVSGNRVVWQGQIYNFNWEVFTWAPATGTIQLTNGTSGGGYDPQVSGDRVVWQYGGHIFTWTPATGTAQVSQTDAVASSPQVSGNRVVWEGSIDNWASSQVYAWTPSSGIVQLSPAGAQGRSPRLSGDRVVWKGSTDNWSSSQILTWTPPTGVIELTNRGTGASSPLISGDRVVWMGNGTFQDVFTWTPSGGTVQLTENDMTDWSSHDLAVSDDRIVWQGLDGHRYGIFTATPALDRPTITSLSPSSGLPAGGNQVTIYGSHFVGVTGVIFGSSPASIVSSLPDQVVVSAPPGTAGQAVNIRVTTAGGTSPAGFVRYAYAAAPTCSGASPDYEHLYRLAGSLEADAGAGLKLVGEYAKEKTAGYTSGGLVASFGDSLSAGGGLGTPGFALKLGGQGAALGAGADLQALGFTKKRVSLGSGLDSDEVAELLYAFLGPTGTLGATDFRAALRNPLGADYTGRPTSDEKGVGIALHAEAVAESSMLLPQLNFHNLVALNPFGFAVPKNNGRLLETVSFEDYYNEAGAKTETGVEMRAFSTVSLPLDGLTGALRLREGIPGLLGLVPLRGDGLQYLKTSLGLDALRGLEVESFQPGLFSGDATRLEIRLYADPYTYWEFTFTGSAVHRVAGTVLKVTQEALNGSAVVALVYVLEDLGRALAETSVGGEIGFRHYTGSLRKTVPLVELGGDIFAGLTVKGQLEESLSYLDERGLVGALGYLDVTQTYSEPDISGQDLVEILSSRVREALSPDYTFNLQDVSTTSPLNLGLSYPPGGSLYLAGSAGWGPAALSRIGLSAVGLGASPVPPSPDATALMPGIQTAYPGQAGAVSDPVSTAGEEYGELATGLHLVGPVYTVSPEATAVDLALTLAYTAADLGGLQPSDLELFFFDSGVGTWAPLDATLDETSQTLTAPIAKTGSFALGTDETGPTLAVLSPLDGATIAISQPAIDVFARDATGIVALAASVDGTPLALTGSEPGYSALLPAPLAEGAHTLALEATDAFGNTSILVTAFSVALTTPEAPASITAVLQARQPQLSWAPVPGSASYLIERSAEHGPWFTIADTTNTALTDDKADPLVTYRYRVRATGDEGALSAPSPEASLTIPTPFVSRALTAGWNLVAGTSDSDLTGLLLFTYGDTGYSSLAASGMDAAGGYWCKVPGAQIVALGTVAPPLGVVLRPGWNLIGNSSHLSVSLPSGLVAFVYTDGTYISTTILQPGQGAWVKSDDERMIALE